MTQENIEIRILALKNAGEFIRQHVETGLCDDDLGCKVKDYDKQAKWVAQKLDSIAAKYSNKIKNSK